MAQPDPSRGERRRAIGQVGKIVCLSGVFASGWMAMRFGDWRQILLWTVIAGGCGWFASRFAAWSR